MQKRRIENLTEGGRKPELSRCLAKEALTRSRTKEDVILNVIGGRRKKIRYERKKKKKKKKRITADDWEGKKRSLIL